jgi:hypothetical protein
MSTPISSVSIWHQPSSDQVALQIYRKEQKKLIFRLVVAVTAAIPIFIIGILYMSLLKADNPGRLYFERPIWIGHVGRGEWASFIISTPVMFYAAEVSWNGIFFYTHWSFDGSPGLPSEIVTGTLVPLETRKSSIMGSSFSSFWQYEFTRESLVDTNLL